MVESLTHVYSGKVRDLYALPDGNLLLVASDRISAYDFVLPTPIPDKGRVLTQMSMWWFEQLADIVPNHVVSLDVPANLEGRAMVCERLTMYPVECVARGYLAGSGLVDYRATGAVCGLPLPAGLEDGSRLPAPIFTPATKAGLGEHDENVSFDRVVDTVGLDVADELRRLTIEVYARAEGIARERGIVLADTKLEFGHRDDGTIVLADEVLTPDSSRFWPLSEWSPGHPQPSFDKQYVRDWLTSPASGWDRHGTEPPPPLPDDVVVRTRAKYLEAYETLTGEDVHVTRWVVTGGAGYIGAHVVRALLDSGREAVVLDDLSSGFARFVPEGVPFVRASILDPVAVREALRGADGVVHLAGWKYAGVSVEKPLEFYRENIDGTRVLLEEVIGAGIPSFVFSSSASVFGTPDVDLVDEDTPVGPESPYGETKLAGEWLLRDVCRITRLRGVSLRYFNVVGSGSDDLYDASPHNLFPLVLAALKDGRAPTVHGDDYPTPDGSCVRDYIHVVDVADAHVAAIAALEDGREVGEVYNLGRGEGVSVLEILEAFRRALGKDFPHIVGPRRTGDPARIVTSAALAAADLAWTAKYDLDDMVTSAVAAAPR